MRGTLFALSLSYSEEVGVEANVFIDGEVFIKPEALRHVAEMVLGSFRIMNNIEAGDAGRPLIRRHDAREHAQCGRFPGAVGPDQTKDFAGAYVEA